MAGGAGSFRDDNGNLVFDEASADMFAERMATRFHALGQKLKGGALGGPNGAGQPNPVTKNQWGGKGIIKFNPTSDETTQGFRQQTTLFTWESPDGLPHNVVIDVGRLAGGIGGPGADGTPGGINILNPLLSSGFGQGSVGGGTWPSGRSGNAPLSYRAVAQVLLGTPGTMQDPFFIDINRGQRVCAVASYVAVTAQMLPPPVQESNGQPITPFGYSSPYTSGSMVAYATLSTGVTPSISPVIYTQYIDLMATDALRAIPPRANFLMPILSGAGVDAFQFLFYDNAGTLLASTYSSALMTTTGATPFAAPTMPLAISTPIPEDAYAVLIHNQGGANSYRLIYQLSV